MHARTNYNAQFYMREKKRKEEQLRNVAVIIIFIVFQEVTDPRGVNRVNSRGNEPEKKSVQSTSSIIFESKLNNGTTEFGILRG